LASGLAGRLADVTDFAGRADFFALAGLAGLAGFLALAGLAARERAAAAIFVAAARFLVVDLPVGFLVEVFDPVGRLRLSLFALRFGPAAVLD
jgi:hypothetical protein